MTGLSGVFKYRVIDVLQLINYKKKTSKKLQLNYQKKYKNRLIFIS